MFVTVDLKTILHSKFEHCYIHCWCSLRT